MLKTPDKTPETGAKDPMRIGHEYEQGARLLLAKITRPPEEKTHETGSLTKSIPGNYYQKQVIRDGVVVFIGDYAEVREFIANAQKITTAHQQHKG